VGDIVHANHDAPLQLARPGTATTVTATTTARRLQDSPPSSPRVNEQALQILHRIVHVPPLLRVPVSRFDRRACAASGKSGNLVLEH